MSAGECQVSYSLKNAALATDLDKSHLVIAIDDGALKARKVGQQLVITRADLAAWLQEQPTVRRKT